MVTPTQLALQLLRPATLLLWNRKSLLCLPLLARNKVCPLLVAGSGPFRSVKVQKERTGFFVYLFCLFVCWNKTQIDGCCFYYFVRNSLVALLEALRSLVGRSGGRGFVGDRPSKNEKNQHTDISNLKRFEQIELQAKLLNYFLENNKSNSNQCARIFSFRFVYIGFCFWIIIFFLCVCVQGF